MVSSIRYEVRLALRLRLVGWVFIVICTAYSLRDKVGDALAALGKALESS